MQGARRRKSPAGIPFGLTVICSHQQLHERGLAMSMRTLLIVVVAIIVAAGAYYYYSTMEAEQPASVATPATQSEPAAPSN
jgi:drug/metabolite transporter (DMT)-like permease